MHQPDGLETDTLAGYEWPLCAAGPATGPHAHHLWQNELDRLVCWPCEERTRERLTKLRGLFTQLNKTDMLMKGSSRTNAPTSGTRTAPVPLRLDVLNLTGPGGIATRLQAIEDSWRKAFGRRIELGVTDGLRVYPSWRANPAHTIPGHIAFLAINLQKACEEYESIGQDINTIRVLHAECTAPVENKPRTGQVKIGLCPVRGENGPCATQLTATTRSFTTQCPTCGTTWEGRDEWQNLRHAQDQMLTELAGAAA